MGRRSNARSRSRGRAVRPQRRRDAARLRVRRARARRAAAVAFRGRERRCIERIGRRTAGNTDSPTAIANLAFFRREEPMPPAICLVEPSVVLVVQGEKQMLVGGEAYPYDIHRFLITSLDLPANSRIVSASPARP